MISEEEIRRLLARLHVQRASYDGTETHPNDTRAVGTLNGAYAALEYVLEGANSRWPTIVDLLNDLEEIDRQNPQEGTWSE